MNDRISRYGHILSPSSVTNLISSTFWMAAKHSDRFYVVQDRNTLGVAYSRHEEKAAIHLSLKHNISVASERMFHERIFRAWSTHVCFTLSFTLVGNFRLHMPQNVSEEKHSLSLHTKGTGLSRTGYGQRLESEWETGYLLKDCALLVKSLNLQV